MTQAGKLRALLRGEAMVIAPGAYDGLTAMLVEQAGFAAVYMTGAGTSVSHGYPDFGLLSAAEMIANADRMARAIDVPLIADADTGYGNELNVTRTVREFESRGVAAIHLEDQVSPKRCGHLDGKEVVSPEEFVAKIAAAAVARRDPDTVLIARTDARAMVSFDDAVARANGALAAGADIAFVEALQTQEEIAAIPQLVKGPCLLNLVPGGKTPNIPLADVAAMGYRVAILPGLLLLAVLDAGDAALFGLKRSGVGPVSKAGASLRETFRRFGTDEWDALRRPLSDAAA